MRAVRLIDAEIQAIFARHGIKPDTGPDGFGAAARAVWREDRDDFWRLADLCGAWFESTDDELTNQIVLQKGRTSFGA